MMTSANKQYLIPLTLDNTIDAHDTEEQQRKTASIENIDDDDDEYLKK